jgi:hypothetical protein
LLQRDKLLALAGKYILSKAKRSTNSICTPFAKLLLTRQGFPLHSLQRDKLLALTGEFSVVTIKKGAHMFLCTPPDFLVDPPGLEPGLF